MMVLALQGALVQEGLQEKMGHLGLLVNQVIQEVLEFLDSQGEMDAQGLRVGANHKHTLIS